jgi:VCBS repeat-containing protein
VDLSVFQVMAGLHYAFPATMERLGPAYPKLVALYRAVPRRPRIAAYLDGNQVVSVTDTELTPYLSGGVSLDMWTDLTAYKFQFDDVMVKSVAVNDGYTVTEDSILSLPAPGVLANDTDANGDLLAATVLSGPAHGALTVNLDGSFTYTPDAHYSGADSFTYGVDDGRGGKDTATVNLTVTAVADAPTITVAPATGNEDSAIALDVAAALVDTDGSETLSLQIGAIPVGATLSDGSHSFTATAGNTAVDVTGWTLASLTVTPPADSDGDFALTVTATSTEASNGDAATTTASLPVTVTAVADAPALTVAPATGNEDTAIALSISPTLTDADGSESLAVQVGAIPVGATLSDGINSFTATPGNRRSTSPAGHCPP